MCLILVLVLLISWSPIRAKAVGTDQFVAVVIDKVGFYAQAGAVSTGAAVFGYVLMGLGLVVTAAQTIDLMNDYMEWSGELDVAIYYYPDGSWSYGVDMGFVERVKAFLWDQGIIVQNTELQLDSVSYPPAEALAEAKTANYSALVYYRYNGGPIFYTLVYSNESQILVETPYANNTGLSIRTKDNGASIYIYDSTGVFSKCSSSIAFSGNKYYVVESTQHFGQLIIPDVRITIDGAEIAVVAPPEFDISVGYPEWHINARPATNPDTDQEITILPIPLNPSVSPETQIGTLTQPDIWQGSIADPMPQPDPGIPGVPPSDIAHYQVDLKSFFPFCIPFDFYEFIRILCAEPEAPVFHWEIQDLSGNVYSVDVDLSPWNSHAQLFRDAECFLFIVGLLMLTRKFIKW